jgi:hypothetical protein
MRAPGAGSYGQVVSPIRVLLSGTDAALRAAVRTAVAGDPNLTLVGEVDGEVESLLEVARLGADIVVVGATGPTLPPIVERLVDEYTNVGVLAVDLDRDEAIGYRLEARRSRISGLSVAGLAAAIRQAAKTEPS